MINQSTSPARASRAQSEMTIVIDARDRINPLNFLSIWAYRELLAFMIWREVTVRYKQTALGVSWMIIQPIVTIILYTVVFGNILGISSGDYPYPVFVFSGLLPWRYFTTALTRGVGSLVGNAPLIQKVYFPRHIIILAAIVTPLVDLVISFVLLAMLMVAYNYVPLTLNLLLLPAFVFLAFLTALAMTLWLAALNVFYRDFGQMTGFITQAWMYITPVIYPVFEVPEKYQTLYAINPMVGVVEGFRWVLLGADDPNFRAMGIGLVVVLVVLLGGVTFFSRMERSFGDVI